MKIVIAGTGYVGLSLATLLSQKNEVVAFDINTYKVDMINKRISPIQDDDIEYFFKNKNLDLKATSNYKEAFENAKYIIICTPTDYDEHSNKFDTSSVEDIIKKVMELNHEATIVIKSTIPIGFVDKMKEKYKIKSIVFSPEFLREGKALYDNLYPSRIIVGEKGKKGMEFANLLKNACLKDDVEVKLMNAREAEAVKLFANTYLALRIAYFNELDTFAELNDLNTKDIIEGVSLDPRIGNYYNNPSFGYGGYCLPKDTKQLKANYKNIPENLISAIIKSNDTRKKHIVDMILKENPKTIGIYRLTMKRDSTNFRESAILDIMKQLQSLGLNIIIYEPLLNVETFDEYYVINDFEHFKSQADIILANRMEEQLKTLHKKVYTRDIYNIN